MAAITAKIKEYAEKYRGVFNTPGLSIIIVKDGKSSIINLGTLSVNDATPVNDHTLFQVASVTKNFTATLMARLVEKGVLSFDDKVSKYLPDFQLSDKTATHDLRIKDLLCHCIGLEDFAGDTLWHGRLSQEEVLKHMRDLPFKSHFRSTYAYSNIMVGIAGLIIEKVTGKPIDQVMKEELFTPLGMTESSVGFEGVHTQVSLIDRAVNFLKKTSSQNKAKPHDLKDGKPKELDFYKEFYLFPGSSGVNTTPDDMAKWLNFHLNGYQTFTNPPKTLISPEIVKVMRQSYVDGSEELAGQQFPRERVTHVSLGLGWFMYDYGVGQKRLNVLEQMGGITGARALLVIVPSENLGIAVLANLGGMRASLLPEAIVQKFLDLYMGIDDTDWAAKIHDKFVKIKNNQKLQLDAMRLKNPEPSAPLKTYEGHYSNPIYGDVDVTTDDQKNLSMLYRGYKIPLKHINGHYFYCSGQDLSEGFSFDDPCIIEFGVEGSAKTSYGLMISLLDEGDNSAFYRKDQ